MGVLAPLSLILLALLSPASTDKPSQPCPLEMNKVKDLLEVNCTGQALSTVPPDLPKATGILLLSANNLASLSTAAFLPLNQLQDLDLSNNGLVTLHTGDLLPSLRELILSHNTLEALPALQGLPALTRLAVAHNRLVTLEPGAFRAVPKLQDLDLRGNSLQTLPQEAFAGLWALKDLDLSDNVLEKLPKELLQDLEKLETLWLSGNRLQSLPKGFFREGHLFAYVFLTENPWHCDCDLSYLRKWIKDNRDSVYQPERGLEKTKVEVAPEKVLCHSPPEYWQKPIIYFSASCGAEEDADEEDEEEIMEKPASFHQQPPTPKEQTTMPASPTPKEQTTMPASPTPKEQTTMPASPTPKEQTTMPASPTPKEQTTMPASPTPKEQTTMPASPTLAPTPPPSTARPASTPTTTSTRPPSTSSQPPTSTAAPSTTMLVAYTSVGSSSPPLMSTTPVVSTTVLSTHAPTPPAPLYTRSFTQPAPSPPPLPLCPCSTSGLAVPILRSRAGGEGPQWGQSVLRHCCLLHWVLYLASLALLVLTVLALTGWLVWLCLVQRSSWHRALQTQEVQYPLLRLEQSAGSSPMHLSSFKSPLQRPTFCTIKEIELCPEVTYCTIKDLGIQGSPASSSFCTTKELWVHHHPQNAAFKSFSKKLVVPGLGSLRTPSAYSLDRGVKAIGGVRVKYAGNTL